MFYQGDTARFLPVAIFSSVCTFRLCWFGDLERSHFFKITTWSWSVFRFVIMLFDMGVVHVSLMAWFAFCVHKSRFSLLRRHIQSNSGVFSVQQVSVLVNLIFKVVWNLGLDLGRHVAQIERTENRTKREKFKRSDRVHCGFSTSAWMSCNTQEMSEIEQTAITETAS